MKPLRLEFNEGQDQWRLIDTNEQACELSRFLQKQQQSHDKEQQPQQQQHGSSEVKWRASDLALVSMGQLPPFSSASLMFVDPQQLCCCVCCNDLCDKIFQCGQGRHLFCVDCVQQTGPKSIISIPLSYQSTNSHSHSHSPTVQSSSSSSSYSSIVSGSSSSGLLHAPNSTMSPRLIQQHTHSTLSPSYDSTSLRKRRRLDSFIDGLFYCSYCCQDSIYMRAIWWEDMIRPHIQTCPFVGCEERMLAMNLDEHKQQCAYRPFHCPFCHQIINSFHPQEVQQHLCEVDHMTLLTVNSETKEVDVSLLTELRPHGVIFYLTEHSAAVTNINSSNNKPDSSIVMRIYVFISLHGNMVDGRVYKITGLELSKRCIGGTTDLVHKRIGDANAKPLVRHVLNLEVVHKTTTSTTTTDGDNNNANNNDKMHSEQQQEISVPITVFSDGILNVSEQIVGMKENSKLYWRGKKTPDSAYPHNSHRVCFF